MNDNHCIWLGGYNIKSWPKSLLTCFSQYRKEKKKLHFFVCFSITWISFDVFRLCDEATSALDSTTEAEILSALKSLANNRTSVFIAHRLTTAMQCDEVSILCKNYEQNIWRWFFKVLCWRSSCFYGVEKGGSLLEYICPTSHGSLVASVVLLLGKSCILMSREHCFANCF